jgi:D-alanyl-D-alanine carboxypeptidase
MRRRMPLATPVALAALVMSHLAAVAGPAAAEPATTAMPQPKADIVVDAGSGRPLVCDNVHEAIHPASTAKIMTALVAAERLSPNAPVTVDATAAAVEANKLNFPAGATLPLDQALASLMMVSANDAAYAIAHTVGGSLDKFAAMENDTARRLGLKNSILNDPAGLDDTTSYKGGPLMSAYDLAVATRNALAVPAIAKWAATRLYDFSAAGSHYYLKNHNRMLPGGGYDYAGITGFKTGYTEQAQHSLVATATRNGRTMIAVVLGAVTPGYVEAAALLDAGFAAASGAAPASPGCGNELLPPTRVSLYASRAADQDAFKHLGGTVNTPKGAGPGTAAAAATANTVVPPVIPSLTQAPRAAAPTTTVVAKQRSDGLLTERNGVVVLILVLLGALALRRRAVKRRRARRAARARQRAAAMRSGGLPVVDGRYRPGMRLGPPVESHVRVRRVEKRATERSRLG